MDEEYSTSPRTAACGTGCQEGNANTIYGPSHKKTSRRTTKKGGIPPRVDRIPRVRIGVDKYGRGEQEGEVPNDLCVRKRDEWFSGYVQKAVVNQRGRDED